MNWNKLITLEQLDTIDAESNSTLILLFKHSTSCSISSTALNRIERKWQNDIAIKPYYLDLLAHRDVSNEIEKRYHIQHQSPQVLVINKGKCVYTSSHSGISYEELLTLLIGS
jgi:bacillithiol system protein YtxJ